MKIFKRLAASALCLLAVITVSAKSFPILVWQGWEEDKTTEASLQEQFATWKAHGVTGVCMNVGFNVEHARIASEVAHRNGLEFHAWMPCMLHKGLPSSWYAVNRKGERADSMQAYVPYYTCLDPNNKDVQAYLIDKYKRVAALPSVDYVQLDYIRYPDVILAKGLWSKYNLVMNEEYPTADYCYCDDCVAEFKAKTGIDIRSVQDPSKVKAWAQFRCDVITNFVNKLCAEIHAMGKKVSADVFPGPKSHAVWMVRQEWNKWNVDAFLPMNYNDFYLKDAHWLKTITKEEVKAVKGKAPIYSGLFICNDWRNKHKVVDPEASGLLPSEIDEAIKGCVKAGAMGISLFTSTSMTEEHWQALSDAIKKYVK